MTTNKKLVIAVVALSLVLLCAIGGTLAFLVAQSNVVTNTFTYGTITLELSENNKADKDGLEFTNVVPGDELDKDPVITVVKGSETCYVYVLIDNQLGAAATYNIDGSVWQEVSRSGTKVLYRYNVGNGIVDAGTDAQDLAVFTKLTFDTGLDKQAVEGLVGKNVVISAYAHQSEHVDVGDADTAAIAWAAAN